MTKKLQVLLILILAFSTAKASVFRVLSANDSMPLQGAEVSVPLLNLSWITDEKGECIINQNINGRSVFIYREAYICYAINNFGARENEITTVRLQPLVMQTKEVVISGIAPMMKDNSPQPVEKISIRDLSRTSGITICDGLSALPGVSQLISGNAISKPVIRGLHGNRVAIISNSLHFDNQQWQDEHGMGLNENGLEGVEIVKGAASLLYGSDAIGGIINFLNEKPAAIGFTDYIHGIKFFSNTLGSSIHGGVKSSSENKQWHISMLGETHADYTDGSNKRILNTRFNGMSLKTGVNFISPEKITQLNFDLCSYSFGFIPIAKVDEFPADGRFSRSMGGPHHSVHYGIATLNNTWLMKNSTLKSDAGMHINNRQEQEYGNRIALNMLIFSGQHNLRWTKTFAEGKEFSIGSSQNFSMNRNYGSNIIVPNANTSNFSVYGLLNNNVSRVFYLQTGIRYDFTNISVLQTSLNAVEVLPYNRSFHSVNFSGGINALFAKYFTARLNVATGFRSPNLSEIGSDGVHEGTLRWEIGNHDMKQEQCLSIDAGLKYEQKYVVYELNFFRNYIRNFIYLSPQKDSIYAFRVYRFLQNDALMQGFETGVNIKFPFAEFPGMRITYSHLDARLTNGNYLPMIPANKVHGEMRFDKSGKNKFYILAGTEYVFAQNRPADLETSTPAYYLLNASVGFDFLLHGHSIKATLSGSNLLNQKYYDHLSLLKPVGIYNMGRNIAFSISASLHKHKK